MPTNSLTPSTTDRKRRRAGLILGAVAVAGIGLGACGSSSNDNASSSTTAKTETSTTMAGGNSSGSAAGAAMKPSGPGCASVPTNGKGSFAGMATDPAATAASNNPLLTTLVKAVTEAKLGDTLNGPGPFTIFAPVNDAFAKIPADQLNAVLANQSQLTDILTYHVVSGEKLSSTQLAEKGKVTTVEGKDLTITKSGDTVMVNGANVICMDVPTANATVHIIDGVLMPSK